MTSLLKWLFIYIWLCQGVLADGVSSFLWLGSQRYRHGVEEEGITSLEELLQLSDSEEPLVVFQFDKFDVLRHNTEVLGGSRSFLASLFQSDSVSNVLREDAPTQGFAEAKVVEVAQLPASASEFLIGKFSRRDSAVVVEFSGEYYNPAALDEFLETLYSFLEESMSNIDNIVVQTRSSDEAALRWQETRDSSPDKVGVDNPNSSGTPDDGSDPDALSSLWTEGLLSCLLVSALLLGILVTAISWVSSIHISYGALEKSTNPLKKTN